MNNGSSLVSIIVPCYNYGHLIHETLDSVLAQGYSYWECIVVDDGSTDNTRLVVEKYVSLDFRFKYIYQKNKGLSAARNAGLRIAEGEYIQLLDSDDLLPEKKIQTHVALLDMQKDIDLVYGAVYIFEKYLSALSTAKQFIIQKPVCGTRQDVLKSLVEDNIFLVHCALFRRSILKHVGLFNEEMITCEDWNFWFRCVLLGKKIFFLDNADGRVYVRSHGINMSTNRKNMWRGNIHFRKEAERLLADESGAAFKSIRERNTYLLLVLSTRMNLAYGNIFSGLVTMLKTIFLKGDVIRILYDSLYWIKERALNKV